MSSKYFTNINDSNDTLRFKLNNVNNTIPIPLANAIRRVIMSEIPIIAIDLDSVNFINNTSILHNDYIKHRLSMIPVKNNKIKNYENYTIKLNVSNNTLEIKDIYVKNFEVYENEKKIDNSLIFVDINILFSKLKPNNQLTFEGKLTQNISKNGGAAFTPVAISIYRFEADEKEIKKILSKMENESDKIEFKFLGAERLYKKNKFDQPIAYNFTIESLGMIPNKNIISMAINVFEDKLKNIKKAINENDFEKIQISESDSLMDAIDYIFIDEDDTLGNCLAYFLYNNPKIEYSGYYIPHPLDKKLILRVQTKQNDNLSNIINNQIDDIIKILNKLKKDWK